MKLACVIHRFGPQITGGSEAHCRAIALQLAGHGGQQSGQPHVGPQHEVDVLTSCATDYVTWANVLPAGDSQDGPLRVRRFQVAHPRHLNRFREISEWVFSERATEAEQTRWFEENGPDMPALLEYLRTHGRDYDRVLFWSFRYAPAFFGVPLVADRAILVPTAEDDDIIRTASILGEFFAKPRAYLFLTPEERDLVAARCRGPLPPAEVIGAGLNPSPPLPPSPREQSRERGDEILRSPGRGTSSGWEESTSEGSAREGSVRKDGVREGGVREGGAREDAARPFALYVGRIEKNKGCDRLIDYFLSYADSDKPPIDLVMAGPSIMTIPSHPRIKVLGVVPDAERDALLSRARVLVMPSPYESLSMVVLEAWRTGTPVLVNGRCKPLRGQTERANGGLFYEQREEFVDALAWFVTHPDAARQFGSQGRAYVEREYAWPAVLAKIERVLKI
jgi:glycosyltransferase involved in cell wall biosynthesis